MKSLKLMLFCLIVFLGVNSSAIAAPLSQQPAGPVLYVKQGGTGDCLTWGTACDLQTALSTANSGDQIWVAAGTYMPTAPSGRFATFQLESGVAIYGGFPADGGEERDWQANITTLSGDIGNEGNTDNSYHVVTSSGVDDTAILDGFTISGGNANGAEPHNSGGGMNNVGGNPTLNNIKFSDNAATTYGGGMNNDHSSSPMLTNVTFSKNMASYGGGMNNADYSSPTLTQVAFTDNSASNFGGGMHNRTNSKPTLNDVTFSGNTANYGGGISNDYFCEPTLTDVTISGNTATASGGGMYNRYSSIPTLTNVTISDNSATISGGGMYNRTNSGPRLTKVTFSGNSASGSGGGMYNEIGSDAILTEVTFSGNSASQSGGGMYNENGSDAILTEVTISDNRAAASGGGMYNQSSNPTLTNVTISGNSATTSGGGMYNLSCSPTLTNVTISGNSATTSGGGIFNTQSNPTLTNITIFGNNATTSGGGMYNENQSSPTVTNSIYWANTPDQIVNITSSSTDVSYSDIQNWASGGTGNIKTNPLLDETLFKGSDIFTQTHALLAGSPAIDTANPTTCPTYDQRYFARPIDGDNVPGAVCDMGAFEYASTVDGFKLNVTVVGGGSVVKNPNKDGYVFGEAITLTAVPIPGWTFSHWSGDVPDTANPLTNPLTMNIRGITNITANFVSKIYLPLILKN